MIKAIILNTILKKAIVIGAGFSGLSAASFLARAGWQVTVIEKHPSPGGRARRFTEKGFTFDMGPSWYWMPDVFERYFASFGKEVTDYYSLKRLDPSYSVMWEDARMDLPAGYGALRDLFDRMEPGSGARLDRFLQGAAYKYEVGMHKLVRKPGRSWTELLDPDVIRGVFRLDVFSPVSRHIRKYFRHPKIRQLLEFPVLFLGALPSRIPALYSLMNYADIRGGTWYPEHGIYRVIESMHALAMELGVQFRFGENVTGFDIPGRTVTGVAGTDASGDRHSYETDVVVASADYHFVERALVPAHLRSYPESYWSKRVLAPSCLLYYVGLDKRLPSMPHHLLFFDTDFAQHGAEIYESRQWPHRPLFYVSAPSVSDDSVAPEGCENLFFLIPVASGLQGDTAELRDRYFDAILARFEDRIGEPVRKNIIFQKSYGPSDFVSDYNAYQGNAYGLANTLMQTALFKPSCRSKKIKNLFYTGQFTVPGPGVPPALISGEVVAGEVVRRCSI